MRFRPAALILVVATLLTGCAPPVAGPSSTTAPIAVESNTPEPEASGVLLLSAESVTYQHGDDSDVYPLDDGEALLRLLEELAGRAPDVSPVEGPYDSVWGTGYEWPGLTVSIPTEGSTRLTVDAPSVGDVRIETANGIAIGSSRADVVAAGAFDVFDSDGDGVADQFGLDPVEAPGTESLATPGSAGIIYVLTLIERGTVVQFELPANDFTDI